MSRKHKEVFSEIAETTQPGDVLFITSLAVPFELPLARRCKRRIVGFDSDDTSQWHTALYLGQNKRGNLELAESIVSGVRVGHLPSTYYTRDHHLEIGRYTHQLLDEAVREKIVQVAREQVGKNFDRAGIKGIPLRRTFGLPNIFSSPETFTCQGLVLFAYERAGVAIPNLPVDGSVDHDLYRSPDLELLLRVEEKDDGTLQVIHSPEKYSWSQELARMYGCI